MPSAKGPGGEIYSTTLRQAMTQKPSEPPLQVDTLDLTASKSIPLKLPQLHADERVETSAAQSQPANENNTLLLMQSWQRGKQALTNGSKQHLPTIIMFCGATVSAMWLAAATVYIHNIVGWSNIKNLMPHEIGGFLAGLLAPVALFWMLLTFWLRSVDVKLYAEALRTEIQNMIFPSDEAERRVNNDIERLVRQTAEMSRATRMALGTLKQAREAVRGETQALQNGVKETAERLEELEQRLSTRHTALADLQNTFAQKGQALEQTSAQLVKDASAFDTLIGQTASKTDAIGQTLQAPLKQLQTWQDGIVDALNGSLAKLDDKRALLRVDVSSIEEQAENLATTLDRATGKLYNFTDDALDKAKIIETRLQGQGLSLQETLDHIAKQTESLTQQRDQLLKELAQSTEHGKTELMEHVTLLNDTTSQLQQTHAMISDRMQTLLHDAKTSWSEQAEQFGTHVQTTAVQTIQHLDITQRSLQQTHETVTGELNQLMQKAADQWTVRADQFSTQIHADTVQQIDLLNAAQTGLQAGYTTLQGDLDAVTRKVNTLVQNITGDMQVATGTLQNAIATQQNQTQDFVGSLVQTHRQAIRSSAEDLTALQTELNALATQLAQRGEEVSVRGTETASLLQTVHGALNDNLDRLSQTTQTLHDNMATTTDALNVPLQKLEQAAQNAHDKAQVIGNMLDQRVANLYELGGALTNQASSLGTDLVTKSQLLENVLVRLQGEVKTINSDMAAQTDLLDNRVRVTVDQVNSLLPQIQTIQQNVVATNEQIERAQTGIVRVSETAQGEANNLIQLSDKAVERITDSLSSYKELQDGYQALHNATLNRHQQMRDTHQQDIEQVVASHEQLITHADQIGERYKTLQATLQDLQSEAGQSQTAATQAQQALQQTRADLAQTGQTVQQQTDQAAQNIRVVQQILDGSAQSALNHVQNLTSSMQIADKQAASMQERMEKLQDVSIKQTDVIVASANRLHAAVDETGRSYERVRDFDTALAGLQEHLSAQQSHLYEQRLTVEETITDALQRLQRHTDELSETTQKALQQADVIREQDQTLQRDYFFNATKFIVESLHSLALDFTRMLDGELPEKTWRAYKLGDTSAFTKRLVGLRDSLSHDKLRQKFADDVEFRTYVQRYLRQFEEIHEHAKKQDHGDLLSGVFTSSDVGRLYQMLKTILTD